MSTDATTREDALERKVDQLEAKRADAQAALDALIASYREEAGSGRMSAAEQAYADVIADLEPIAEGLGRYA